MTTDKKLHLIAGFVIYIMTLWVLKSTMAAFWLVFIAGATKELVYDKLFKQGYSSWSDFSYTIIGGYIGALLGIIQGIIGG